MESFHICLSLENPHYFSSKVWQPLVEFLQQLNVEESYHRDANGYESKIELSKRKACILILIMAFTFLAMILGLGFTSYKNDLLQKELNSKSITTHFGFINIGGSDMYQFNATSIYFWYFAIKTSCSYASKRNGNLGAV